MGGGGGRNKPSSRSRTKRPSFFKVLVGDFTNQLRIPRAFLNHFNGKLPEESTLKSPTGRYWNVKMKKVEKDLVFRQGWETFVKVHSLEFGDFLVFRYSGNCKFKLKIYGRNACEKVIAPHVLSKKNNIVESNSHKKKQKTDVATEKCAKFPRSNGKGFEDNQPKKNNVEPISHKKKWKTDVVATEKYTKGMSRIMTCEYVKQKRTPISLIEKKEESNLIDSSGISCFTAVCRPCRKFYLTVPKKVAKENELMNKSRMQLRDPNGRLWPVNIVRRNDGRINLGRGWREFCKEHNLGGGEICRFKFMQGLDNEISVEIFRGGLKEYQSKRDRRVESVRDATLKTESNDIENGNKEPVEEPKKHLISVKEEISDDSSK